MDVTAIPWGFYVFLFTAAFLYSSVGHGGASGYLALMALFGIAPYLMKSSALFLNVFVSGVSFFQFYKNNYFKWKLFYPFAISSIPFAFLGALVDVNPITYKRILGILLLFPILRLLNVIGNDNEKTKDVKLFIALLTGAGIGFFSGMIGIGGGIILSPVIVLLQWGNIKQTAAVSALFIFVNSLAGIAGLYSQGKSIDPITYGWLTVALSGGILGAYFGSKKFSGSFLKQVLAAVLIMASVKLLFI